MLLPTRRIPGAARPSSITRRCSCSQRSMVSLTCDHHGRPLSSITASRDNHLMRSRRGTWGTASALSLWSSRQNQSASSFLRADHWPRGGACTDRIDDHAKQDEQEDEARERLDHRDNEHPVPKLVAGARKQNCICLCAWLDPRAKQQGPDARKQGPPAKSQSPVPPQARLLRQDASLDSSPHHTTPRNGEDANGVCSPQRVPPSSCGLSKCARSTLRNDPCRRTIQAPIAVRSPSVLGARTSLCHPHNPCPSLSCSH